MENPPVRAPHGAQRLAPRAPLRIAASLVAACLIAASLVAGCTSSNSSPPRPAARDTVLAIAPPAEPLASEDASAGVTRFSFIVYGDTRGRRDGIDEQYEHSFVVESMLDTIASLRGGPDPVRFVLQSGDAVVDGGDAAQWNVSFVGLVNRITTEGGVPYFLVPGNHDVTSSENLGSTARRDGLRNYLAAMDRLIPPDGASRRLTGYPTYAFGYGNTFVLAIDSNIAGDATQFAWARAQLDGLDRQRYTHVVAFFHHPPFSSGPHGGPKVERPTAQLRAQWMPLFRAHGVDLLFTGHEHLYEHWVERWRDASGGQHRMDQIVTGGGGAPPYLYTGEPDLRAYLADGARSSVRLEHLVRPGRTAESLAYHYVVVHVDGARVWEAVISVGPGQAFKPYPNMRTVLGDTTAAP